MKINLYATFRQVTGAKYIELDLRQNSSVPDMLEALLHAHPQLTPLLVDNSGQLLGHIHIFINGRDIQYLENGMRTSLAATDTIDIFPPVAGG